MSSEKKIYPSDLIYSWTASAVHRIEKEQPAAAKADLANLRRGLGKQLESSPEVWGMILSSFPEELYSTSQGAGSAENAVFYALTLYGMMQQGHDPHNDSRYLPNVSLGQAAAQFTVATCKPGDEESSHILSRFKRLIASESMKEAEVPLRSLLQLLAQKDIGLDFALLAKDLFLYDISDRRDEVRMKWARDYYRKIRELRKAQEKKDSQKSEEGETK